MGFGKKVSHNVSDRPSWIRGLKSLAIGTGLATLAMGGNAIAADQITLRYEGTVRTVPVENFSIFAETGEAVDPDVEEFFAEFPLLRDIVQEVLTAEIIIPPSVGDRLRSSSVGQFILLQLNKLLTTPTSDDELDNLRTALVASYESDNRFSLLEIINAYPQSEVVLELDSLRPIYDDVKVFVERIQPALEVAREFLQDLICDCETATVEEDAPMVDSPDDDDTDTDSIDADSPDDDSEMMPDSSFAPTSPSTASATTCNAAQNEEAVMAVLEQLMLGHADPTTLDMAE